MPNSQDKRACWQRLVGSAPEWMPLVLRAVAMSARALPDIASTHVGIYVDLRDLAARAWFVRLESARTPEIDGILADSEAYVGTVERTAMRLASGSPLVALPPPAGMIIVCGVGATQAGHVIMATRVVAMTCPDDAAYVPLPASHGLMS